MCIADSIKEEAHLAVSILQKMGIKVAMLTGDNTRTVWAIARPVSTRSIFPSQASFLILKGLSIGKHNKSYSIEKGLLITKIEVKMSLD